MLNPDTTILTLEGIEGEIAEGMIVENLSDEADAFIHRSIMRNNRARGMLIAAKGHIEITDNRFTRANVPCVAVDNVGNLLFERNEYTCTPPYVAAHAIVNGEAVE